MAVLASGWLAGRVCVCGCRWGSLSCRPRCCTTSTSTPPRGTSPSDPWERWVLSSPPPPSLSLPPPPHALPCPWCLLLLPASSSPPAAGVRLHGRPAPQLRAALPVHQPQLPPPTGRTGTTTLVASMTPPCVCMVVASCSLTGALLAGWLAAAGGGQVHAAEDAAFPFGTSSSYWVGEA